MRNLFVMGGIGILAASCATLPPPELLSARSAVQRAATGTTEALAPGELARARDTLQQAETVFANEPKSPRVLDYSYAAETEARAAEVAAQAESARRDKAQAESQLAAA